MNWDAIAAVAEFAGTLAVIATLIYLSYQLRQSNLFAKAEAIRSVTNSYEFHTTHLQIPALSEIIRRGYDDFEGLSRDDQTKFNAYHYPFLNQAETVFEMHDLKLIEDSQYSAWMAVAVSIVYTPGGRQWWAYTEKILSKTFVDTLNRLLEDEDYPKSPLTELLPWMKVE